MRANTELYRLDNATCLAQIVSDDFGHCIFVACISCLLELTFQVPLVVALTQAQRWQRQHGRALHCCDFCDWHLYMPLMQRLRSAGLQKAGRGSAAKGMPNQHPTA